MELPGKRGGQTGVRVNGQGKSKDCALVTRGRIFILISRRLCPKYRQLFPRGPGTYNLYLGAGFDGSRLSKLYAEDVREKEIIALLGSLFARYAVERQQGERFGDFVIRVGAVAATLSGRSFHDDVRLANSASMEAGMGAELHGQS